MHRDIEGCTLLTVHERLHHKNVIAKSRANDALKMASKIYNESKDQTRLIETIMLLLADVPHDPLLSAKPENIASVLGLCSLGILMHHDSTGMQAREIAERGEGVMILRISGGLDAPKWNIELFNTWAEYEDFLRPLLETSNFVAGKSSTLL
ncbi:MAG: hypothetical protein M0P59_03445 [Gallionella sp.]|jgi:hypothetical protein|nr:hypothetical protein [Gallionella sp.]